MSFFGQNVAEISQEVVIATKCCWSTYFISPFNSLRITNIPGDVEAPLTRIKQNMYSKLIVSRQSWREGVRTIIVLLLFLSRRINLFGVRVFEK